jgi:thiol-disulfide isomerase/thioredoxin
VTQSNAQKKSGTLRTDQNDLIFDKGFSFSGYERDALFLNLQGKKFQDISGVSGIDSITDGRAAVFADFDNDGDYDVFLTTIQGPGHLLFRNNVGQDNHWLRIILEGGRDLGRDAYGSVVRLKTSAGTLTKIKSGGAGFLSQHDPRLLFGLGLDESAQSLEVTWANGKVEAFQGDLRADATLLLREGTGRVEELKLSRANLPDPLTREEALAQGLKIRVGQAFPDVLLKTLAGQSLNLKSQLKTGRRLLINLWATWCVPCATEMPELEQLRAPLAGKGIDLIGVSVDADPEARVAQFAADKKVHYPIYLGGVPAIEQIFLRDEIAVPLTVLLNEKGAVEEILFGFSGGTQRRFSQLAGTLAR